MFNKKEKRDKLFFDVDNEFTKQRKWRRNQKLTFGASFLTGALVLKFPFFLNFIINLGIQLIKLFIL